MEFLARNWLSGRRERVVVAGRVIASVEPNEDSRAEAEPVIAPAFWDLQTNGGLGVSFSSSTLTVDEAARAILAPRREGVAKLCPTLISAPAASMLHGLRTIAKACESDEDVAAQVLGVHLEGPYLSSEEGYRGAHPADAIHDPDWAEFQAFQEAAGGRIRLITLAPERVGSIEFIRRAVGSGVVVALGHTAADGETLARAADAGARLSTHLGNGIAALLPRHPNPIWVQAADDRLYCSLIADGHHLDRSALRVLVRAKTPRLTILVSDASPLAGLPPGSYGAWSIDAAGRVVVTGTTYLAGANRGLDVGLSNLMRWTGATLAEAVATVTENPARLLETPGPRLFAGEDASFVLLDRADSGQLAVRESVIRGVRFSPQVP